MKTDPKFFQLASLLVVGALGIVRLAAVEVSDILTPPLRQEALDDGKRFLAPREVQTITVDPFHPDAFAEAAAATPHQGTATADPGVRQGPRSNREILEAIAAGLKPSGNFVINGQQTLLFGQKRVKAGGLLTITFEGTEYTLEVTAIQRTNFTLRLNREEFTRPIK